MTLQEAIKRASHVQYLNGPISIHIQIGNLCSICFGHEMQECHIEPTLQDVLSYLPKAIQTSKHWLVVE